MEKLLEDCQFEKDFLHQVITHMDADNPTRIWNSPEISTGNGFGSDEILRIVDRVEKLYGKSKTNTISAQRTATPSSFTQESFKDTDSNIIRANPVVDINPFLRSESGEFVDVVNGANPWKRTCSRLGLLNASAEDISKPIDVEIVMVSVHEVSGTIFKHVNYKIEVSYGMYGGGNEQFLNSVAIRRYSDFDWLHSYLIESYPFRAIPPIPPKQLSSQADLGLARERISGLHAFLMCLIHHPVISKDSCFKAFLTEIIPFSEWRTLNPVDIKEEACSSFIGETDYADAVETRSTTVNPDDQLFTDAQVGLLAISERLTYTLNGVKSIASHHQGISTELDLITADIKYLNVSSNSNLMIFREYEKLLDERSDPFHKAYSELNECSNAHDKLAEGLRIKSQQRLAILHAMVQGMISTLVRLPNRTFNDFVSLSNHLGGIQSQLERMRLSASLNTDSHDILPEMAATEVKLKKAQRIYAWNHKRNESAVALVQHELKRVSKNLKMLPNYLSELSFSLKNN